VHIDDSYVRSKIRFNYLAEVAMVMDVDPISRRLLQLLAADGRASYQALAD
jgi:hypothetical protein